MATAAATFIGKKCRRNHTPCVRLASTGHCVKCQEFVAKQRRERGDRAGEQARQFASNPELHARKLSQRLQRQYGITLEDYNRMLAEQGGVCAICREANRTGYRLGVDHCHATGVVGRLLCTPCNAALGHMKDSPELLRRAADYLEAVRGDNRSGVLPLQRPA